MQPKYSVAADYTYHIDQKNATTYYLKYTPGPFDFLLYTEQNVMPKWMAKAEQLCGSTDFEHIKKGVYLGMDGLTFSTESPHVYGTIYCNNKFQDTRDQKPDEAFAHLQNISLADIEFRDVSPLWMLLTEEKFADLDEALKELEDAYAKEQLSEADYTTLLDTFNRRVPEILPAIDRWVEHSPKSHTALYVRALNNSQQAWFHRGNGYADSVSQESFQKFHEFNARVYDDIQKGLALNPSFFPLHAENVNIHLVTDRDWKAAYQSAVEADAAAMSVKAAYLRAALPRWGGSLEEMQAFITQEIAVDQKNEVLQAHYLIEEASAFERAKEIDKAIEKYQAALEISENSSAHIELARIYMDQSKLIDASKHLEQALQLTPYNTHTYRLLSTLLIDQGDYVSALAVSHSLLALDSTNRSNFMRLGGLHYYMRRYDDALTSYKIANDMESNAYTRHRIRAVQFQLDVRSAAAETQTPDAEKSI